MGSREILAKIVSIEKVLQTRIAKSNKLLKKGGGKK